VGRERLGRWGSQGGDDVAATGWRRRRAEDGWVLPGGEPRVDVEGGRGYDSGDGECEAGVGVG